ncbi:hypothetical protein CR513_29755, partial [Mucuna pruriens]
MTRVRAKRVKETLQYLVKTCKLKKNFKNVWTKWGIKLLIDKLLQTTQGGKSQFEEEQDNEEEEPRRRRPNQNNQRRQRNRREDDLGGIQIKVPSFQGKSYPKAYLEWEMRSNFLISKLLKRKFHNKLQHLSQGSKSVDD